jgi:hypothetical protein
MFTSGTASAAVAAVPTLGLLPIAVAPCSVHDGSESPSRSSPTKLLAALTKSEASRLQFYSDGHQTVLGPRGWACQALLAGDGSQALEVYPAGSADAVSLPSSTTPGQSVYAASDLHSPSPRNRAGLCPVSAQRRCIIPERLLLALSTAPRRNEDDTAHIRHGDVRPAGRATWPCHLPTSSRRGRRRSCSRPRYLPDHRCSTSIPMQRNPA